MNKKGHKQLEDNIELYWRKYTILRRLKMKDKLLDVATWMIFTAGVVIGFILGVFGIDLNK